LDSLIERARSQFAKIRENDKVNSLRALFLGLLFFEIKTEAGRGNFMRIADTRMPEICRSVRNDMMALAMFFIHESKVALPPRFAIPDAQTALELTGDAVTEKIVREAVKFVGSCSIHDLMVKYNIREKKPLGGARSRGADGPIDIDPERLHAQAREEVSAAVESLRHLLLIENICVRLTPEETRAVDASLDGMLTTWRRGLGKLLKAKA
jgi:hypothetical protein